MGEKQKRRLNRTAKLFLAGFCVAILIVVGKQFYLYQILQTSMILVEKPKNRPRTRNLHFLMSFFHFHGTMYEKHMGF